MRIPSSQHRPYPLGTPATVTALTVCTLLAACTAERQSDTAQGAPVPIADWADTIDTLPGTYTLVMKPAEYWDSVLIVPDMREQIFWRVNMATGARDTLGRRGGGPGEYERVGWAAKVHQDSVLVLRTIPMAPFPVLDVTTGRGRSLSLNRAAEGNDLESIMRSISAPHLAAGDTLGHVFGASYATFPPTAPGARPDLGASIVLDTIDVVRYSVRTGAVDTVARFPRGVTPPPSRRDAQGGLVFGMELGPYGPYNGWAPAPDGRLLLVDAASYELRIIDGANAEPTVFAITNTPVPASQSGWDAHVQKTTRGSIAIIEQTMNRVSEQLGKTLPTAAPPKYTVPPKPATLPPVNFGGGVRTPYLVANMAWIPVNRVDPPGPEFWDIIDIDRRERLTTLALPDNHRMVLVTERGAYVVAKDEDDLERVLLYRWKTARP